MATITSNPQIPKYPLIFILFMLGPFYILPKAQNLTSTKKKAIEYYRQGDNYRVRRQYDQAIQMFELAIDKDKKFAEAHYLLGMVYVEKGLLVQARNSLQTALSLFPEERRPYPIYLELARLSFQLNELEAVKYFASEYLDREKRNKDGMNWAKKLLRDIDFMEDYSGDRNPVNPQYLPPEINKFEMQYFPALTADQLSIIYTTRTMATDENIVIAVRDSIQGKWNEPKPISNKINTTSNEGTCSISADGRILIFTACQGWPGLGSCDLFISRKKGKDWSIPENLGPNVNSKAWDSQPTLSADGRTIYFSSNRQGGEGGRDIWVSRMSEEDKWLPAVNLGKAINTELDELSPFIHTNNTTLYFASDGHAGFGSVDIFVSEREGETWTAPRNLGNSINNKDDQLSLFITADGKTAYYSDEKARGMGWDSKLAKFNIPEPLQVEHSSTYVFGIVTDKESGEPLHAEIELFNLITGKREFKVHSDDVTGDYLMVLTEGAEYALYTQAEGYLFNSLTFTFDSEQGFKPIEQNIELEKLSSGVHTVLNNIYFDLDSYELDKKSETELNRIRSFMEQNPEVKIEIEGHTDNTGTESYNQALSNNRAKAVVTYLLGEGIAGERLTYIGKGSDEPIDTNESEQGRARNRRIEVRVK